MISVGESRTRGLAYADCVVRYDHEGDIVRFETHRSPDQGIYIGVPCNLLSRLDPVLKATIERVQTAYEQTYWAIPMAFEFGQACQALAKRNLNIDCIALLWGPGGVGLSLMTAQLDAMYGSTNHKYFDPNVFYVDDELRKVIELLVGGIIFTGQERPTGQRGKIREDLLKKFTTAEGISGRLPYSIITKMHKVIGWKRLELNKLIDFEDITEQNFESIARAFAACSARFSDAADAVTLLTRNCGSCSILRICLAPYLFRDRLTTGPFSLCVCRLTTGPFSLCVCQRTTGPFSLCVCRRTTRPFSPCVCRRTTGPFSLCGFTLRSDAHDRAIFQASAFAGAQQGHFHSAGSLCVRMRTTGQFSKHLRLPAHNRAIFTLRFHSAFSGAQQGHFHSAFGGSQRGNFYFAFAGCLR